MTQSCYSYHLACGFGYFAYAFDAIDRFDSFSNLATFGHFFFAEGMLDTLAKIGECCALRNAVGKYPASSGIGPAVSGPICLVPYSHLHHRDSLLWLLSALTCCVSILNKFQYTFTEQNYQSYLKQPCSSSWNYKIL